MRKRQELTSRKKHHESETQLKLDKNKFASHNHPNSNSNAIGNNEDLFQQTRNTVEKIGASYSNIVKRKTKKCFSFYRYRVRIATRERI